MDEELTAYHESGHACIARLVGGQVDRLTIEPPWDDGPERFGDVCVIWDHGRFSTAELAMAKAQTALAGPVAEMIYSGDPYHPATVPQWQTDWEHAAMQLHAIQRDPARLSRLLEQMTRELYQAMKSESLWAAVAALADELLAHETLDRERIDDVLGFWLSQ